MVKADAKVEFEDDDDKDPNNDLELFLQWVSSTQAYVFILNLNKTINYNNYKYEER